jgi:hypothetical protein
MWLLIGKEKWAFQEEFAVMRCSKINKGCQQSAESSTYNSKIRTRGCT